MRASYNRKAKGSLFFGFDERRSAGARGGGAFGGLALDAAEFFGVCENEIHVLLIDIVN